MACSLSDMGELSVLVVDGTRLVAEVSDVVHCIEQACDGFVVHTLIVDSS
jgi:hypothetical protein